MATIKNQFTATQTNIYTYFSEALFSFITATITAIIVVIIVTIISSKLHHKLPSPLQRQLSQIVFFFCLSNALNAIQKYISNVSQLPVLYLQNNTLTKTEFSVFNLLHTATTPFHLLLRVLAQIISGTKNMMCLWISITLHIAIILRKIIQ